MSVSALNTASPPGSAEAGSVAEVSAVKLPERPELVPKYFDTDRIVTPADNPAYTPAMLADLRDSMREDGQRMPAWICPDESLPEDQRLCLDGNRRLAVARMLGLKFWAFELKHSVTEQERIRLTFSDNFLRRRMSIEEIAERAARYVTLANCTQGEAAKHLNISPATLSRAFGDRRIPLHLKERADRLGLSIRSLIASLQMELMEQAIEFAETPVPDGKKPTRDQVAVFNRQLKKSGKHKSRKPKAVTLRINGRTVTFGVSEHDSAASVAEDFKSIATRLGKLAEVPPEGWHFHFV